MMRNSGRSTPPASPIRTTTPPAEVSRLACTRDTLGGLRVELGAAFDELAHDRVGRMLDLVHRADGAHTAVIEHRNARPDAVCAPHVVRDDDARDTEAVAHANHELVDDGARDGVETRG